MTINLAVRETICKVGWVTVTVVAVKVLVGRTLYEVVAVVEVAELHVGAG